MMTLGLDETKIGESFMWYCLSQLSSEKIEDCLYSYREDFRDYVLDKLEDEIVNTYDDKVMVQHKSQELKRDLDMTVDRVSINIGNIVKRLGVSKDDWKKSLGL